MRKFIAKGLTGTALAGGMLITGIGPAVADSGADAGAASVNQGAILSGNNLNVPINIPITACGNAIGILVNAACAIDGKGGDSGASAQSFSVNEGAIGSGNNVNVPVNAPITACGNALGFLANAECVQTGRGPAYVPVPTGCVHDCSPVGVPVFEPCRENCRPVTVAEPCRKDCGPAYHGRPVLEPGRPRHDKPVTTVPVATGRSVTKDSSGGIAHTGLTAVAVAPIGGMLLLAGMVFYRRSRVRTNA